MFSWIRPRNSNPSHTAFQESPTDSAFKLLLAGTAVSTRNCFRSKLKKMWVLNKHGCSINIRLKMLKWNESTNKKPRAWSPDYKKRSHRSPDYHFSMSTKKKCNLWGISWRIPLAQLIYRVLWGMLCNTRLRIQHRVPSLPFRFNTTIPFRAILHHFYIKWFRNHPSLKKALLNKLKTPISRLDPKCFEPVTPKQIWSLTETSILHRHQEKWWVTLVSSDHVVNKKIHTKND